MSTLSLRSFQMSVNRQYCGDHSDRFWKSGEIGPCWRTLVFAAPFGVFLGWWGVGSFFLTRSRHPRVLACYQIGPLDLFRALLCLLLAIDAPLLLYFLDQEPQPHEYVDAFLANAAQWLFLGAMVISSAVRATKDTNVMKIAALLSLLSKSLLLQAMLNSGEDDYGEDYDLRQKWMSASFVMTLIATFSISCVARNHRALQRKSRLLIPDLEESLLGNEQPVLPSEEEDKTSPEDYVGWFSQLTFSWLSKLMRLGYSRPLNFADLYKVRTEDTSELLHEKLSASLKMNPSLIRALYSSGVLTPFILAAPLKFIYDTLLYTLPATLLRDFIQFLGEESKGEWYNSRGTKLAIAMFVVAAIQTFSLHVYFNLVFRAGMRVRTALVTAVFNKTLRLSLSSRNSKSNGELANLISTDAQRMQDLFPYLHVIWSAPLQISLCTYFLWRELRWASVIALATIVLSVFVLTGFVASRMKSMNKALMASKDKRVRSVTEALSSIKLLKLYGWETIFKDRIANAREKELEQLRRYVVLNALTRILWSGTPIIVTLVTFGSFVALGGELDAATAFVSVTLLQLLRFPMAMLPTMFSGAVEANVSLKRIENFLNLAELSSIPEKHPGPSRRGSMDDGAALTKKRSATDLIRHQLMSPYPTFGSVVPSVAVGGPALEMISGTYYWDDAREKPALEDVNLRMNDGEICIVTGEVGSGKTALILGLLGELVPDETKVPYVSLNGSVALAPQVPWIRNASVRDNILFGQPYDEAFYNEVLDACALVADMKQLPNGDATEIGEKGINLSGGQKARVSLARAVYSRSDILLLESCFEAVDEHVATALWQKCFFGTLKRVPSHSGRKRTVIVVTYSTKDEAEMVDRVIIMNRGRVMLTGTPTELASNDVYRSLKRGNRVANGKAKKSAVQTEGSGDASTATSASSSTATEVGKVADASEAAKKESLGKLISAEKATGRGVDVKVYRLYLNSLGGTRFIFFLLLLSTLRMCADIATSRWLAHWSNDVQSGKAENHSLEYYLTIYGGLSLLAMVLVSIVMLIIYLSSLSASRWYHGELLSSIMRAPMSFFDSTPLGRITQRFTKDMNTLDNIMSSILAMFVATGFDVLGTIVVVAMVSKLFLIPLPFLGVGYFLTQRYYVRTSRELKNLDSISLSPIFSHFQETLEGCVSVRAYKHVEFAIKSNFEKLDKNLSAYYLSNSCNRWLAVRMEFVGNSLVFLASILTAAQHGHVNAALAGMAVSYTLTVTQSLNWFVRMSSDMETNVVSVERIDEYAHGIVPEAPLVLPTDPQPSWPQKGEIVFKNVVAKYRPDLEDVLKGVDFTVPAGAHVGICGKTGCGKSTMFLVLLRIVESHSGAILIDGVNTKTVGLKRLRDSISIIPQDAVLFNASLRYNLDPTERKTDAELWQALDKCELTEFVKRSLVSTTDPSVSPLDVIVAEGGANFSFGQRQLMCIARALLRDTKILLSDEASSGIDRSTDHRIQDMIRREFASRTTLTIAHRLETIIGSDYVALMENGRVVEFDNPKVLMENSNSKFFHLAHDLEKEESTSAQ